MISKNKLVLFVDCFIKHYGEELEKLKPPATLVESYLKGSINSLDFLNKTVHEGFFDLDFGSMTTKGTVNFHGLILDDRIIPETTQWLCFCPIHNGRFSVRAYSEKPYWAGMHWSSSSELGMGHILCSVKDYDFSHMSPKNSLVELFTCSHCSKKTEVLYTNNLICGYCSWNGTGGTDSFPGLSHMIEEVNTE